MTVSEAFRQLDWYFSADDGSAAEEKTKLAYRVLKECAGQMAGLKKVEARHKIRYMSITPHIYIRMLDGETKEQCEDRLVERIDPDGSAIIGWDESKVEIDEEEINDARD